MLMVKMLIGIQNLGKNTVFDYPVFHSPLLDIDWKSLKENSALNQHAIK